MQRVAKGLLAVWLMTQAGLSWAQEEAAPPPAADTVPVEPIKPVDDEAAAIVPETGDSSTRLDEVIVTAQKRVESLQSTPISISALNKEKLTFRGVESLADLGAQVPAMTIEPFPTHNATLRIFIRGIGVSDAQVTQDPAVGVYLDGVYIARSVGLAFDIADLERIEVLRGPQGTLYGRNTTGGAINLVTRRPQPGVFTMEHQLTGASRDRLFGKSSFNIPLGDTAAFKLSLLGSKRDGWVENEGPGGDFGDREENALRFDLRWLPTDWLTLDYGYDRTDNRYYNTTFQSVLPSETNHGPAELFKPYAQSQTRYSTERLDALATGAFLPENGTRIDGHALTLTAPLGQLELKYIGSYRDLTDDQYADLGGGDGSLSYRLDTGAYDGPSADMLNGGPTPLQIPMVFQEQTSHELQLSGKLFDDSLEFIVGAFHFDEKGGENGRPLHHILNTAINPAQLDFLLGLSPELFNALLGAVGPQLVAYWDYEFGIHNTAQAYFGQATWSPQWLFDGRLHLTAGLRHSRDVREAYKDYFSYQFIEALQQTGQGIAVEIPATADNFDDVRTEREFTDTSPSFNIQYDLREDITVYATAAEAYKSGGFNTRDPHVSGASEGNEYGFGFIDGFAPESVKSYELGVKSEWMNRRLRLNADVFDSRYTNQQINFLISGTISDTKTRNVGRSRIKGFEMDAAFVAAPGLILALDYAYLDARTLDVRNLQGGQEAHLFPFISAPRHSGIAAVDWTFAQLGWGDLRAYVNYNYTGYRNGLVIVEERRGKTALDPFGVLNARLTLGGIRAGERGTLDVALWGRNILDEEYELTAIDNLPQADRAVIWAEPVSVGLDLIYRFH